MTAALKWIRQPARQARGLAYRLGAVFDLWWEGGGTAVVSRLRRGPAEVDGNCCWLAAEPSPGDGTRFDVIYAIGYWDGEPKRYRVFNMAEGLRALGYSVHVMAFADLRDIPRRRWSAAALVLFRAEYDRLLGIDEVLAYAGRTEMLVVYDVDDLVFDETVIDRIDGLRFLGPVHRRRFVAGIARRRRLMAACDQVTVSTQPLARAAAALGRPSSVIPNALNARQLDLAGELTSRKEAFGLLRIGYFSGSHTHQRDFAECAQALFDFMRRHAAAVFRVVGYLDLDPRWDAFDDRVERIGFVAPAELLRLIAETDINLAPLELGNPFCEAKSELKFFEAAIVGVPTIASATEPFADVIEDGISGFLARTAGEWEGALERLAASSEYRQAVGEAAKARALARHSLAATIPQAVAALRLHEPGKLAFVE